MAERHSRRWSARLAALLSLALVLGACGSAATTPTPATSGPATAAPATAAPATAAPATAAPATAAPATGGVLTAAWAGPCCNGVDYLTTWDEGGTAHWLDKIYGRLTEYTVKDPVKQAAEFDAASGAYGELQGDLAESWSVSDDKLTWTFKLRQGVTWHDGEPFTADDVKFTFDTFMNPKNTIAPCYYCAPLNTVVGAAEVLAGTATEISGVTIIDPHTISLTFVAPNALFPATISELFIAPKHALEDIPLEELKTSPYWQTEQIGTGPFMWDTYTPGQSIELVPFDNYWRGKPKLERIIRREFQDLSSALLAFDNGELDFVYIAADEVERQRANPDVVVLPGNAYATNPIQYNSVKHPEFANKQFRQALLAAIDRQAIIDSIYKGAASLVPCLYGQDNLTAGVTGIAYDPANAKDLLAQSGVDLNALGTLNMNSYYRDPLSANVMQAILKNWADNLGIKAGQVQQLEDAAWNEARNAGDFDVMFVGAANGPTGDRAFNYYHSSTAYPAGSNGFEGYAYLNPALDKLLEDGRQEFDQAKQDAIYQQACAIMADDLPWLFLWQTVRFHVASKKVQNLILIAAPGGGAYYDAAETWSKTP